MIKGNFEWGLSPGSPILRKRFSKTLVFEYSKIVLKNLRMGRMDARSGGNPYISCISIFFDLCVHLNQEDKHLSCVLSVGDETYR